MRVPKAGDSVNEVLVDFGHNASRVLFEQLKKRRLVIVTRRFNNRYLVTLRDSHVIRKFTPDKIYSYCEWSGREVEINVDDIKSIKILN